MYQIDNATAAATQPASTAAGTPGFFTDGSPAGGVPATIVPAEWLNSVQQELINAITTSGQTPNKAAFNQLSTALQGRLLNIQKFDTVGAATYTKTAGTKNIRVIVVAGGGGGGGCATAGASAVTAGGGGGTGTWFESQLFPVPASPVAITIGAGGAGGSANGVQGGTSSFGSLISCPGGFPGGSGNSGQGTTPGGGLVALPTATVPALISSPGAPGGMGLALFNTSTVQSISIGGQGGASPYGVGANWNFVAAAGQSLITGAGNYGGGGGGAMAKNSAAANGSTGASGVTYVLEYS